MITVINNGTYTFNAVRVGAKTEIDEKFLSVYEEHGFEVVADETAEVVADADNKKPAKKETLKKVIPG